MTTGGMTNDNGTPIQCRRGLVHVPHLSSVASSEDDAPCILNLSPFIGQMRSARRPQLDESGIRLTSRRRAAHVPRDSWRTA